jgi:hypothetical protein
MEHAESASRESKHLEFKREFEVASGQAWCELIKDIVAIANSGGGIIIIGVANDGSNAAFDASVLLAHDTADIANRIARYTGNQLIDIEVMEIKRNGQDRAAIFVSDIDVPIVFTKPGTYDIGGGQQRTAFAQGTIYFRHGSKSEPGNREDLANWRDREIAKVRKSWLVEFERSLKPRRPKRLPLSPRRDLKSKGAKLCWRKLVLIHRRKMIVPGNAEEIWPHRQKDLIREVNKRLGKAARINSHDIFCIKRVYGILKKRPDFAYRSHHLAPPQYSSAFVEWIA